MSNPVFYFDKFMGNSEFYKLHYLLCSKLLKVDFLLIIMEITGTTEEEQCADW